MKRKNVLITGANSPFGKYICSYLKNKNNFKIYGISRRDENLEEFDEVFIFDIRKNIIPIECEFDYIFHVASAVPSKYNIDQDFFDINVNGSLSLFRSIKISNKAVIINMSSTSVYDDPDNEFINEESKKEVKKAYGLSKLTFENELHKLFFNKECMLITLRIPVLLVPEIKGNFISSWASKIINGQQITLYNPNSLLNAVISGKSIIQYALYADYQNKKITMNLASKNAIKIIEVAKIMSKILDKKLIYIEEKNDRLNQQIVTNLAEDNGFKIPDLKTIIKDFTSTCKNYV